MQIVRQVIGTAGDGDYVEIGLFIESVAGEAIQDAEGMGDLSPTTSPPSRLRCTFYIAHRFSSAEPNYRPSSTPPSPTIPQDPGPEVGLNSDRPPLALNDSFMARLLQQVGGEFVTNLKPPSFSQGRGTELTVTLDHGLIDDPPVDPDFVPCANVELSQEPTLQELAAFSETLRGKKVTLCASSRGSFAHHLSSYLTAWGLDVSHYALDPLQQRGSQDADNDAAFFQPLTGPSTPQTCFVVIDDNIEVLKESLQAVKADATTQSQASPMPRPSLIHRPKSTPQFIPGLSNLSRLVQNITIVHFTSLANYKRVKDIIQSFVVVSSQKQLPEVLVIPKPAGPRRVLTAFYTALKKPVVDSFFSPIATSPATPASRTSSSYFPHDQQRGKQGPRPSISSRRTDSDKSNKLQGDREYAPVPPSPLSISDSIEYFSETTMKLGTSPSSGLVLQSPDGQPAGIFFLPKSGGLGVMSSKTINQTPTMERDRGQFIMTSRRPSEELGVHGSDTPRRSPRTQLTPNQTEPPNFVDRQPSGDHHQGTRSIKKVDTQAEGTPQKGSTPPVSPGTRSSAINSRRSSNGRRSTGGDPKSTPQKGSQDPKIVPPISVLIVDGM